MKEMENNMSEYKNVRIDAEHIFKKPITAKLVETTPDGTQSEILLTYDCQHNQNKYIFSDKNKYWLLPVEPETSEVYGMIALKGVVTVNFFLGYEEPDDDQDWVKIFREMLGLDKTPYEYNPADIADYDYDYIPFCEATLVEELLERDVDHGICELIERVE